MPTDPLQTAFPVNNPLKVLFVPPLFLRFNILPARVFPASKKPRQALFVFFSIRGTNTSPLGDILPAGYIVFLNQESQINNHQSPSPVP